MPSKLLLFALSSLLLSSVACSLPSSVERVPTGTALKEGARYEVRKALAANAPFEPSKLGSYFVVIAPVHPPMVAATNRTTRSVRTTAYCHDESDHIAYGKKNAIGTELKFGSVRSAAADWSRYPLGTLFRISNQPGVVYQVDDYGSALVGTDTIDLYKPNRQLMNDWGVRHVDIEVIKWGSYQQSMKLIKDRTRFPHVRKMFDSLQQRVFQVTGSQSQLPPMVPITAML
jgi:3D (Asp-Asp-Asp) domain-containing protein